MKDEKTFEVFGLIAFIVILVVWSTLLNGLVLARLWTWFVVPVFALPALTVFQALGLAMVFNLASGKSQEDSNASMGALGPWKVLSRITGTALSTLFVAWVIHIL